MPTLRFHIIRTLSPLYGPDEAIPMADLLLEKITGLTRLEIKQLPTTNFPKQQRETLELYLEQLLHHRPIQYVLEEAWFQEMSFFVDERVLIPRPETEELVEWVSSDFRQVKNPVLVDIGSGSGCIPISLTKKLPGAEIHSCDRSAEALTVAGMNADRLQARVRWHQIDFLQEALWHHLPSPDCLVSNPPYIPFKGASDMSRHVTAYEPEMALFVPDETPFIFYQALARFCRQRGQPGCRLYVEIHEDHALGVRQVLEHNGMKNIELRQDMQGKDRMMKAINP